ncbi:MAG: hypothetical protein FJW88_11600 [Actinobacteria bacterium]|nr:hypothetical protein [Actinomycetota bacterium]
MPTTTRIRRLVGVYDADGTLRGELAYWVGARLGRAHCALCDVTHGLLRERRDWRACRSGLPVPFATCHRDDQPEAVRDAAGGVVPVVVADTDAGQVVLLGPDEIEACAGSPERLVEALTAAAERRSLDWA